MMRWLIDTRRFRTLLVAIVVLGGGWIALSRDFTNRSSAGTSAVPQVGFPAPDFDLDLLTGSQVKLSELRGSVVIVNLWASWCGPCRAEMPAIDAVYQQYHAQGLEVVAINTTFQDSEAEARAFLTELGVTFPVALDRDGAASKRYYLQAMPSTFFVARDGTIGDMLFGGPMTEALIISKIEKLLGEK
ncbi:MAG TPA: TlpA disulfide reductase family protein [Anaerolineae bacterium]|nr:TlpA disulfide reductase family protein [Anaerolineae bacterium]